MVSKRPLRKKKHKKMPNKNSGSILIPLLVLLVILVVVLVVVFVTKNKKLSSSSESQSDQSMVAEISGKKSKPTPPPPVPEPLPTGQQVYSVSLGAGSLGPDPREVTVDPFDPKKGEKQTFSVQALDDKPIRSLSLTLKTDNGSKTYSLSLVQGTAMNGVWQVSLVTEDTHDWIYHAIITGKDDANSSSVELSFR